jgi:hypothetical protein
MVFFVSSEKNPLNVSNASEGVCFSQSLLAFLALYQKFNEQKEVISQTRKEIKT